MHGALESVGWTIGESLELEMEGLDPRGGGGGLRFQRLPQVREPGGSHAGGQDRRRDRTAPALRVHRYAQGGRYGRLGLAGDRMGPRRLGSREGRGLTRQRAGGPSGARANLSRSPGGLFGLSELGQSRIPLRQAFPFGLAAPARAVVSGP